MFFLACRGFFDQRHSLQSLLFSVRYFIACFLKSHAVLPAVLSVTILSLSRFGLILSLPEIQSEPHPACFHVDGLCVPHYLSILTLVKNETPYLGEWLEYHFLVGVDKIWIVDNDSSDNPRALLAPYIAAGLVNFTTWPGRGEHYHIYRALCPKLNNDTYWLALIDVDEFIVPEFGRSVLAFLRLLEPFFAVTLNWLIHGTNGHTSKEDGLVMERFKNHTDWQLGDNRFTKMIVKPRHVMEYRIHEHLYFDGPVTRNPLGRRNRILNMFRRPACHRNLRLDHYWTKSHEEFLARRMRGPGHTADKRDIEMNLRRLSDDIARVEDVITDDHTLDWAIPLVKENLGNRSLPVSLQRFHRHYWPSMIVVGRRA
jgi:hypothetical protein